MVWEKRNLEVFYYLVFDLIGFGWRLIIYIVNKFYGDSDVVDLGDIFRIIGLGY